ncbi:hypothetical protein [Roseomonas mucosa]|uniref:hypothetical protein n=1 Tax=Roseomonas mucosa TaxID=207340 RepID=UPI00223FA6AB|nr:hypothetical protein [Roseomonas mucosa]
MTIFNIDTIRPGVRKAAFDGKAGWLECFVGEGDHWSFVRPVDASNPVEGRVVDVMEKRRISSLCCSGLYHFGSARLFSYAFRREATAGRSAELYVAPMYQHLIGSGLSVEYGVIPAEDIFFSGTPSEYEATALESTALQAAFFRNGYEVAAKDTTWK